VINQLRFDAENRGLELLTTEETFTTVKKLLVKCACGSERYMTSGDLLLGKRCLKCKTARYKETCRLKYGCENTFQSEKIKEKIRQTNQEKLGVDYPQQNKEVKAKTNKTCKEKYGYAYAFNQPKVYEKIRKTHMKNHGVEFPLQSKKIRDRGEETCLLNHGVSKNFLTYKSKDFKMPSGKIIQFQGFEDIALKTFLTTKHKILGRPVKEEEIFTGKTIGRFKYLHPDGKEKHYYPDIFISGYYRTLKEIGKDKFISYLRKHSEYIEVKSVGIFNLEPKMNFEKWKATAMSGHLLRVYIYLNKKGDLFDIWTFIPYMKKPPRSMNNYIFGNFDKEIKLTKGKLLQEEEEYSEFSLY
jgi:hypothetical protein